MKLAKNIKIKILTITFIFLLSISKVFAIDIGDVYNLSTSLPVRNNPPGEQEYSHIIAKLPSKTTIEIKEKYNNDWVYIKWYSNVDKKYKEAFASTFIISLSDENISKEENKERIKELIKNYNYDNDLMNRFLKYDKTVINDINSTINYGLILYDFEKAYDENGIMRSKLASQYYLSGVYYLHIDENPYKALNDFNEAMYYGNKSYNLYYDRACAYLGLGYYSKAKYDLIKAKHIAISEKNEKNIIKINNLIRLIDKELKKVK